MEAILRSVLLRQEQMAMQWDAEFEQQKQLFHINTSTLIDMLPIRPRKERLMVEGRVEPGPIPCSDKENLVGFQGFLLSRACVKSPKTKAPHSRGLAKRDLNVRFCDNDVKDVGRMHSKAGGPELPLLQSALRNGLDAETEQQNGRVARATRRGNQASLVRGVSVKVEVDDGDARQMHVSAPTGEMPCSSGENRKRVRGEEVENVVLRSCDEETKEPSNNPEEGMVGEDRMAMAEDPAEEKSKPKRPRVTGKARGNGGVVENPGQSCRDTRIARSSEPQVAVKVEVEPEEQTHKDAQTVEATEPEVASKGPARRGRAKGASAVSRAAAKAAVADVGSKEPARRGRAKKAPTAAGAGAPEIAQRVTRSRARKVVSVVESEPETCGEMPASQVAGKESDQQKGKAGAGVSPNVEDSPARVGNLEPEQGDSVEDRDGEGQRRSLGRIVEMQTDAFRKPEVCAPPPKGLTRDGPSIKNAAPPTERRSVARSMQEDSGNNSVACDTELPGRLRVSSRAHSQEEAACPHPVAEEQSVRIGCRVAEILANPGNDIAEPLRGGEDGSRPDPQLESIEEDLRHREADFASAERPLASGREGAEVQDGSAPLALPEAPPAEEEIAKNVHCLAASEGDASVGEVLVDRTEAAARMLVQVTEVGGHASNNRARCPSAAQRLPPGEADGPLPGRDQILASDATSIREVSRASPTNGNLAYTAMLSEMIEGNILPRESLGGPVRSPESVVLTKLRTFSLQSGRSASAAVAPGAPDAGGDAPVSGVHVLPAEDTAGKSTAADRSADGRDAPAERPVGDSIAVFSEGQRTESDNVSEECSIEANIQFAERSWHAKRDSVRDVVVNTTSAASRVKEPENAGETGGGASWMDASAREQVKTDAVSPVRYSEARAIEEAMRCSLEQEFHPDVTLTLNRWQFRKRLSPRSKARARRWRSDVAANGVDYGRGQSSDAPVASPSRVVPPRERSMEGAAYETFLETQAAANLEAALEGAGPALRSGAGKAVDQGDTTSWQEHAPEPEGVARRSTASLCNEFLSQALHDGEVGDNSVDYEVMETVDENGNLSPLLQSIYKLSRACENDMVGGGGILEEGRQQVQSLIESAKKIMEQVSSKRAQAAGAPPSTPASNHPAPDNSRFHDHTNLYPDRFRLFITPRSSPAAPRILPPHASIFAPSATPAVASVLAGVIEWTPPRMQHGIQATVEEAVSKSPYHDLTLAESAIGAEDVVSPARSQTLRSGEVPTTADTGDIRHSGKDAHRSTIVRGTSATGSASPQRGSQNEGASQSCDGSILAIGDRMGAMNTAELVTHQSELRLSSEAIAESERLSELRSRFYALSTSCMVRDPSTAEDGLHLLGAGPGSLIKHSTNSPSPMPSLRLSPGYAPSREVGALVSVKKGAQSSTEVALEAGENGEPAVVVEGETRIPCSPIFMGNQRGHDERHEDLRRDDAPLSQRGFQETVTVQEEVIVPGATSGPSEEAVARTQSLATDSAASMLRVEPQRSSNLIGAAPGPVSSSSNLPRSNLVTNMRSFLPLVQQQQSTAPYPNGKRDVKVKALEAAEAAKRLAEQKELEKQERKKAAEIAKREKRERAAQEKLAKLEKAAQDKLIKQQEARAEKENEEAGKRKAAALGTAKSTTTDSSNCQGTTSSQNVLLKVKKTYELKLKMDQGKHERLQEEQRRKEEEWKKKEAENAARKRKHEAAEKKEREEKRRRQEDAMKTHREMEERQRLDLEKKAQKQKALEEMEKERRAIEEELKRHKRLDKEREVEQRRKKEQEKELAWLDQKKVTRKLKEEAAKQMKLLETEGRQQAVKVRRPSEDPAMPSAGPYHSFMASLHVAMGIGEGVGGAHLSGVNNLVDPQRGSSQSWIGHPLRVPHQSGEGAGAAFPGCRNSQTALRVPRTTPESAPGACNTIGGSGKPLFRTPPEAMGVSAVGSAAVACGGASSGRALREGVSAAQGRSGSKAGVPAVAGGSRPVLPGQGGFAGPPGGVSGQGDKGVQSYVISPFRDSEDEDSDEEEKRSQKPIPQWARKENMLPQLVRQLQQDPDDIFVGASSCSLDEVFEVKGSKKRPDFKRRGSSGDWVKDCVTWQEQIKYKVTMGYLH